MLGSLCYSTEVADVSVGPAALVLEWQQHSQWPVADHPFPAPTDDSRNVRTSLKEVVLAFRCDS